MSRTNVGYFFRCKMCGYTHILVDSTPYNGINVGCVRDDDVSACYRESDFKKYEGIWDIECVLNSVKAKSFW